MAINLGAFPILPLIFALLIPIAYSLIKARNRKSIALITLCSILMIALYPLVSFLGDLIPLFGYSLGKIILFVLFPVLTILYLERWKIRDIFSGLGVRRKGLPRSVLYGITAAAVTIAITVLVMEPYQFDLAFRVIMFFESFTEEFFFRGFLFLYLLTKTSTRTAFATSVLGFILVHPQHFTNLFLVSTAAQGILLTIVAQKTRNILGPWIGHGLNRFLPILIKNLIGI
jgi:membrane protease YdiL (CAAX protease family)